MKKIVSVILSLAMLATVAVSVCAAPPDETQKEEQIEITPRYAFTNRTNTNISSKNEDGKNILIPYASATGYRGITTKIIIKMELQQLIGEEWFTIETWEETFESHRGTLEKEVEASTGIYRTYGTYTVYGGDQYEVIGSSSLSYEI